MSKEKSKYSVQVVRPACESAIKLVNDNACPSCEISVLDVGEPSAKERIKDLGIRSIPAAVIDEKLADCCAKGGPNLGALKAAGLGKKD